MRFIKRNDIVPSQFLYAFDIAGCGMSVLTFTKNHPFGYITCKGSWLLHGYPQTIQALFPQPFDFFILEGGIQNHIRQNR